MRPVIVDVARKLTRAMEIGGYTLPAGTLVLPAIAAVHARPDLYPEPEEFRPERFIDGQPESYAWIPFGGGVRRCIGASFAQVEMRVVLREVLRRVRLRAPSRAAGAPARAARDGRARARRARRGDRAGGLPAELSWPRRLPSARYCAGHLGRDSTGGAGWPAGGGMLACPAAAAQLAPDLVQLALRVPEAHRRDQQQQDEDHGPARAAARRRPSPGSAGSGRSWSTRTRSPGR